MEFHPEIAKLHRPGVRQDDAVYDDVASFIEWYRHHLAKRDTAGLQRHTAAVQPNRAWQFVQFELEVTQVSRDQVIRRDCQAKSIDRSSPIVP